MKLHQALLLLALLAAQTAGAATLTVTSTADTGPDWSVEAFGPGADLVLSEASFQGDGGPTGAETIHLSARQAGAAARAAGARRLMLTHLWPGLDPNASVVEGSEAFGQEVTLAAPHQRTRI